MKNPNEQAPFPTNNFEAYRKVLHSLPSEKFPIFAGSFVGALAAVVPENIWAECIELALCASADEGNRA